MKISAIDTPAKQPGAKNFGLKRITMLLAATLTGVLVLLILSAAFLVHNRDFLLDHAEQVWGRKISAGRVEITFLPLGLRLIDLRVADDPAFSAEDFLSAKQASLEIRLLPLFIGQIRPKTIVLDSPSISIVCNADGRYNFASRARDRKTSGRAGLRSGSAEPSDSQERWLLSAPSIKISNGAVRYRDLRQVNELTATGIELSLEDFDSEKPFDIRLEAAVMTGQPNLRFKSRIGPIAANSDYRDVPLAGELNAVDFDLGKIKRSAPQLGKALPRALRFDGIYTIHDLKFSGTLNRLSLKGAVTGTDASFRFE